MQSAIETLSIDRAGPTVSPPEQVSEFPGPFRRHVTTGATIFQTGEQRRLYRVDNGAVCHYADSADGQHEVIEFAFPGDIIGLGCLPTHVSTAKAMVDTCVCVATDADLDRALTNNNRLFFSLAEAREREFNYLRNRSRNANLLPPIQRIANFLLVIVSINVSEGRDPLIVTDDVSSGYVAQQLQMTIDTLSNALVNLRRRGFVDVCENGLRILDIASLETLAAKA
jgi:CRP/FNR family transcriptional regulator